MWGYSFAQPSLPPLQWRRLLVLGASQPHLSSAEKRTAGRGLGRPDYSGWRTTGRRLALASSSRRTGVV
jgi:hypothetical protein